MPQEEKRVESKELQEAPPQRVNVRIGPNGGLAPTDLDGLWRLAVIMSNSGFMPKGVEAPAAVFVAVQMGLEVGLSPMQAVQNIAVINGRPAIWGDAQLGLVEGSGLLEVFRETCEGEFPRDNFTAICVARRKGKNETITNTFSISDAKTANLWNKPGPWTNYPKRMLKMRARAFTLRDGFADVLKGLKSIEEVRDIPLGSGDVEMELGDDGGYRAQQPVPAEPSNQQQSASNGTPQQPANGTPRSSQDDAAPSGNHPRRSRRNKFTGLDKNVFPGGRVETCGVKPDQLVTLQGILANPMSKEWLDKWMAAYVGYGDPSYLREEEILHVLQNIPADPPPVQNHPPQAATQPTPREDVVFDPPANAFDAQPEPEQKTAAEEMVRCPYSRENVYKSFCLDSCRTRKQDGFCIALNEKPPSSGLMGRGA